MNSFVRYLDQFNVLSPNHAKIYDEYTSSSDEYRIRIDTKIEQFLLRLFADSPRSVIMTGNAGDGKTRLCRMVYEALTGTQLERWPERGIIDAPYQRGTIRIVKDLSELTEDVIAEQLERLQDQIEQEHADHMYFLIAANEGKLTKFLSQQPRLKTLLDLIKQRFEDHKQNNEQLHLVNLQDVTSSIYAEKILDEWNREQNWQACDSCDKQQRCVVNLNHRKLTQDHIKRNVVEQYRLLDCLGIHVTMREILIHMSYVITGGLTCENVLGAGPEEIEQHAKLAYYDNFYGIHMPDVSSGEMGAIRHLKKLDPGQLSISAIDDFLLDGDLSHDEELVRQHKVLFDDQIDLLFGYYRKIIELYRTHNPNMDPAVIFDQMPRFRRKYFFEHQAGSFELREALMPYQYFFRFLECMEQKQTLALVKKELALGLNRAFSKKLLGKSEPPLLYAVNEHLLIHSEFTSSRMIMTVDEGRIDIDYRPSRIILTVEGKPLDIQLPVFEYLLRLAHGGLFVTLKQEVDILLNTFKNDLIQQSTPEEYTLNVLALDPNKGVYIPHTIEI